MKNLLFFSLLFSGLHCFTGFPNEGQTGDAYNRRGYSVTMLEQIAVNVSSINPEWLRDYTEEIRKKSRYLAQKNVTALLALTVPNNSELQNYFLRQGQISHHSLSMLADIIKETRRLAPNNEEYEFLALKQQQQQAIDNNNQPALAVINSLMPAAIWAVFALHMTRVRLKAPSNNILTIAHQSFLDHTDTPS